MGSRKKIAWIAGVSAVTVGAVAAAWLGWLPGVVAVRAHDALARRTGGVVEIGGASVGVGGVVLEDVGVTDTAGVVKLRAARVRLSGRPFAWLLGGASGIGRVEVADVEVDVDLSRAGVASVLRRWRSVGAASRGGGGGAARELFVQRVRVRVTDTQGMLVEVNQGFGSRVSGRVTVGASVLRLGGGRGDLVSLRALEVGLGPSAHGLRVERARVGAGRMVWADRGEFARAGTQVPSFVGRRLAAAWATVADDPPSPARGGGVSEPRRSGAVSLSPSVSFVAAGLEVAIRGPDGERPLLRELHATVDGRGPGRFRATGSGAGQPSGTVHWDVDLRPGELRAEGSVGLAGLPLALVLPLLPDAPWYRPEDSRIDAELVVHGDGLARLVLDGRVRLSDVALASARIAPEPVRGISFAVEGRGTFVPAQRRLEIDSARVSVGPAASQTAEANLAGTLEWAPDHYFVDLLSRLPPTPCGVAVGAIPADLLAELTGFSFGGTLSGRVRVRVDSRDLDATRVEVGVQDGCTFETVPAVADLRRFEGPFVHRVVEPDGTTFEMETGPGTAQWTPISEISPFLVQAVVAHEDGAFFSHHGFAPSEIQVALVRNLRAGRYVQGASTITMQLVKNLFLRREKTLARKAQEVLLTWWIERVLDKARILELYLNVIEYGPSIYGIRQAAWHYFGRSPAELSAAESAFLATILPSPKAFSSIYDEGHLSPRLAERLRAFLRRLFSRGRIDQPALDAGLAQVDVFGFFREGMERPPPRVLVGRAQPLPFDLPEQALDAWGDEPPGDTADDEARWYDADGTDRVSPSPE